MYTWISFCMYIWCCFVSILSLFDFFCSFSRVSDSLWSSLLLAINPLLPWLSFPSVKQLLQTRTEKDAASPKCSANAVISSQQDTSVQQLNTNTNWHDGAASEDWSLYLTAVALLVQFLLFWVVLVGFFFQIRCIMKLWIVENDQVSCLIQLQWHSRVKRPPADVQMSKMCI